MPVAFLPPAHADVRLDGKVRLSPTVFRYTFHSLSGMPVTFNPGQFLTFFISDTVRRSYSFASSPASGDTFELVVDLSPGGPGSHFFESIQPGATPHVMMPLGRFYFDDDSPRRRIFIATGTGIAPFRAVLSHIAAAARATPPTHLYWGLRHEQDIYLADDLERFVRDIPGFSYDIVLSKPDASWPGKRGHVTEYVLREPDLPDADYYLCGNGSMIREVEAGLKAAQVPDTHIKKDAFF